MPSPSDQSGRYFIVGKRQRVMQWCRENDVNPHSGAVVHVTSERDVMGHRLGPNDEIVDIGEWDDYPLVVALNARRIP